jgi:hypothetical protein
MNHLTLVITLFFSYQVQAHIEKGTYQGTDQNGNPCTFEVRDTWFGDEIEHPLTEKVPVTNLKFMGLKPKFDLWQLSHPTNVNIEAGKVGYERSLFQDVIPTLSGAASVTITKDLNVDATKPKFLVYIEDDYKNAEFSKKATCTL